MTTRLKDPFKHYFPTPRRAFARWTRRRAARSRGRGTVPDPSGDALPAPVPPVRSRPTAVPTPQ